MADRLPPVQVVADSLTIDRIARNIAKMESGGNYTVANYGVTGASGAYQFTQPTWQSLAKRYGVGTQFQTAKDAPPSIQDQVAKRYISDILEANHNDLLSVPYTWYVGNPSGTWTAGGRLHTPDETPAGNHITVNDYVKKWLESIHSDSTFDVPGAEQIANAGATVGDAGAAAVGAITGNITAIPDFLNWIKNAVMNRDNWVRIGMVVGALLLSVFGMSTISKSFGGPSATDATKLAAKGAMVA